MNIGTAMIIASGLILGYIFPDILNKCGLEEKISYSYIAVVLLPFLTVVAYAAMPIWRNWELSIMGIQGFTDSVFLWFSVLLLAGGALRIAQHYIKSRK